MKKTFLLTSALYLGLALGAHAQSKPAQAPAKADGAGAAAKPAAIKTATTTTAGNWAGTLVDKHCGSDMKADKLASHERSCVMKCAKDGKDLGVMVAGKWYGFDANGEKLGWNILKSSTAKSDVQVNITGTLKDGTIAVKTMTAKATKAAKG